ncbi:MAG TPA: rhomboid family intramembrane serine protease [Bacteroidota bacterium]|nr:rhomboid family intramembrane serine protease [Bacteroidota bacterium]
MTRWVMRILAANVAMFFVTGAFPDIQGELMFVPAEALFRPWTVFTYMFLHAGLGHILFNSIALFFFGPRLEAELGEKHFLWLYIVSGLSGAALSFIFSFNTAIVGASAAIYGVLIGFTWFWPRSQFYIWGILPVEARWLVVGMTALSIFGGFGGGGDGVAHFAHLGGFLGGYLYLRSAVPRRPVAAPGMPAERHSIDPLAVQRWRNIPTEGMHEVNREEYRRIMLKLEAGGAGSLTPQEIGFLERFSGR